MKAVNDDITALHWVRVMLAQASLVNPWVNLAVPIIFSLIISVRIKT